VATEDKRFFEHWGLDPVGLLRAAYTNLRSGRVSQGGSTITQQLAKNLFLTSERSLARKAEELVLALWLEARLGKRNILELYLNRVYFGA
ncbi:transglycosylase domain-containing protein, partial [Vibrio parahaemolyticus]